jgi:ABC-2 type transport system ATP-binding protein
LKLVVGSEAPPPGPSPAHEAASHALELRAVSKRWRGKSQRVLDDVHLRVARGTAVLLTGANGAGKTTLLRVASGVIAPDRGSVTVQGLSPERSRREFNRRIAFLSAGGSGLYARLSVRRHLDLAARLVLLGPVDRKAAMERAMDAFHLRSLAGDRVDRLSMGQRQRVRVAMAFLHGPGLALLDEPGTSLDDEGVGLLHSALSKLLARGGAAIWCEPSRSRTGFAFDQQLVLKEGALHAA